MNLFANFVPKMIFASALFSGCILLLQFINGIVPEPYMDEIFHVDQIKRYCDGRFDEWNDKITTPPALYAVSYLFWRFGNYSAQILNSSFSGVDYLKFPCEAPYLRVVNLIFLVLVYFVALDILLILNKGGNETKNLISKSLIIRLCSTAFNITFFPVLFFSSFLFYTDVLSTLAVLLMYSLNLRKLYFLSAAAGAFSCAVRQTNIVWVAFCAYLTVGRILIDRFRDLDEKENYAASKRGDKTKKKFTKIHYENNLRALFLRVYLFLYRDKFSQQLSTIFALLRNVWPYLTVGAAFCVFIFVNGGVALGDRSAHQACFHLVQFFYCALLISFFGCTIFFDTSILCQFPKMIFRHPLKFISIITIFGLIIYAFTYDHPYLLADNRHYTFYIWRRWFARHFALKFLLTPAYLVSLILICQSLVEKCTDFWLLGFAASVFLVTVPNRLLEFRYFVLPYIFWRLHVVPQSKPRLFFEFLFFLLINTATFLLFLFKPFKWENSDEWQRFMW